MRETEREDFSICCFYERRDRRIFSALFAVITFIALVGAVFFTLYEMENLATSVIGAVLFVQNYILGSLNENFEAASETKPLSYIWSLAVEDKFCIFYPPLLWFMARWHSFCTILHDGHHPSFISARYCCHNSRRVLLLSFYEIRPWP